MEQVKVSILLTVEQVNVVLSMLAKGPFESVAELIGSIRQQAQDQLNPPAPPEVAEAAPTKKKV